MSRSTIIFAACLPLAIVFSGKEGAGETPGAGFRVVGYLPDYRASDLDPGVGKDLTDIVYFSAEPEASGALNRRRLRPEHVARLREIKAKHRVALLLSVGGWERSGGFAALAASAPARARFAAELTRFCRDNDFDGIDIDWEHPTSEADVRNFGVLLTDLKTAFAPDKRLLTIAAAGWQTLPEQAIAAVDRVHLMAYDGEGRHSTFEYARAEVDRLEKKGVPRGKICLGVPFYGRSLTKPRRESTYAEIVAKSKPAPEIDEADGVYFNGIKTIERKTAYAAEAGLAGVMVWEIGQDIHGEGSLLRAIRRAAVPAPGR